MGVCAVQQKRKSPFSPQEIEKVLENFNMASQINELCRKLKGQTQYVFEHMLNNRNINKTICQTEYEFYSKQTEELNLLNSYFLHYYNQYYRIVLSNIKSEDLIYFENLNLKFILELYLAMKTIKNNGNEWWDSQHFYTREKLVINRFNVFPKAANEGRLTPFINFMFLLMKLSIQLMKNEGMTLKEREMEIIIDTRGSTLYNQIKLDFQIS